MERRAKESKSAATIRRRCKHRNSLLSNNRQRPSSSSTPDHSSVSQQTWEDFELQENQSNNSIMVGPKILRGIMSSHKKLFLGLLSLRLLNALIIQTSYVPDEYWQSTEVAHKMVFGYGYLTWEWRNGIRSYAYPFIFAVFYKLLAICQMDSRFLVIKVPRLVQGMFAAVGDLYVYRLSLRLSGTSVARWSLICQITSWFVFYSSPRTLTNSMESVLTSVALYYYPWPNRPKKAQQWKYIIFSSLAIIMRPTAAVTWIPLFLWQLWTWQHDFWKVIKNLAEKGFFVLFISSIIDRIFYGRWTNVFYNFFQFNVLSGLSDIYGVHPWNWYLTQGLPVVLFTHLIIFVIAIIKCREPVFLSVIAWSLSIYSFLSHKEFRFLSGVLPLVMHVCGSTLHYILSSQSDRKVDDDSDLDKVKSSADKGQQHTVKVIVVMALLITNIPVALYTTLIHQRGTVDVMTFVYKESQSKNKNINESLNVLFLMPCHSSPYYSYIHRNISMRFLTCEPNLMRLSNYTDEADLFYDDPVTWLNDQYDATRNDVPTHIITFDVLYTLIVSWLRTNDYEICDRFFHTHFPDGRIGSFVFVLCRRDSTNKKKISFANEFGRNFSQLSDL